MTSIRFAIAVSLLTAVACGGGGGGGGGTTPSAPPPPPPPAGASGVEIQDDRFVPKQLVIEPGTTVRWVLRGSTTTHTTTEMATTWNSGFIFLQPGDSFEHTFTEADAGKTFEYSCVTHKACCMMQGSIRVGDDAPLPTPGY